MRYFDYANKAWYALRRTLPPWSWENNLRELVEDCPRYGIDEVIVKVDTEEFSHHILSVEWLRQYQPILFRIRDELANIGVVFSINPWVTLVHGDRGRNCRALFPDINFMVGHDGAQCIDCACPLSAGWRRHTAALWRLYAETKPDILWVEDDIRTFNHHPVDWGCFCDEHLALLRQRVGETVSREQLVRAILQPGAPHPFRRQWLDLQADVMVETAGILERAVHEVSPKTKMGLMSSGPANHAVEGRRWHAFAKALAGAAEFASRPPLGNYSEEHLKGLYYTVNSLRLTRYVLPPRTIELTEVENCPFTQYNKSTTFTFLQSAVCFSLGAHGLTMNLFDHCGTPMRETPEILETLGATKPYLRAIQKKCLAEGTSAGIRILHHDDASRMKRLSPGAAYSDLRPNSYGWENLLQGLGFAVTYDSSHLLAISGQTIRCFSRDDILSFLKQGVLCDLSAAETLQDMGFGDYLGVTVQRVMRRDAEPLAAEHLFNADFGGEARRYFSLSIYPEATSVGVLQLQSGAFEISSLVGVDTQRLYPGMTLFENALGGRVAVYPFDINQISYQFLRPARQMHIANVIKWLGRTTVPLFVEGGHNTLPFRMDYSRHTTVGVFCLSLDTWKSVCFTASVSGKKIKTVEVLHEKIRWRQWHDFALNGDHLTIRYPHPVNHQKPVLFAITWTGDRPNG